ncbi:protein NTM1-like 9 [Rhodamnia argentea]|uniref:Protein NTM1-like 9 n=1 Tax=Rhodamnia argentea TaxID=178133 RepID=A0A8B8NZX6_9MYRT|nr:protein NTM1-like 9 [Rhodamnia argentea]
MENTISEVVRSLPPGFRFHATDEELLVHYLRPKIRGQLDERYSAIIPEIDVCEFEPWELPGMFGHMFNSKELFFFCRVKRKYLNSKRSDRTTGAGYWKVTGKERAIMSEDISAPLGIKKTLVFYKGRVPRGERTNWVSHEYHINPKCLGRNRSEDEMLPYVACRIKNKKEKKLMGGATISPYTSHVSETPVNQAGDYSSSCNTPNNEVADNQEAVDAHIEMSAEEFMESLPPLQPPDDILLDNNDAPTYLPQVGEEEGLPSLFDFSNDGNGNELDYGYMPSPYNNFLNYSGFGWGNV